MADDLTPGPPNEPLTVGLRIRIVTDDAGQGPFADSSVVASDVAIASSIWQQAGVSVVTESVSTWDAPRYLDLTGSENDDLKAADWDPGQLHVDLYYVETTDRGAGWGTLPWADGPQAICLEDQEEEQKAGAADWRGIALAHELGHYLGLLHTHAGDPSKDAGYSDGCDDTDIADPKNVMTQGKRGRVKVPEEIHLTADQAARARSYLLGSRANLVADVVAGLFG